MNSLRIEVSGTASLGIGRTYFNSSRSLRATSYSGSSCFTEKRRGSAYVLRTASS